jgi:hypothetical protein
MDTLLHSRQPDHENFSSIATPSLTTGITSLPTSPAVQLKAHLVYLGLRALREGDEAHVQLITELLRAGGLRHA